MQGRDALSDSLSITSEVFEEKVKEYTDTHPNLRHPSTRVMREKFLKEEKLHKSYITTACRLASIQTESTEKPGGLAMINHIRDHLISSAADYRRDPKPSRRVPKIGLVIDRNDMLEESIMAKRWRHQKTYLRVVAAELEAMGLALYLDHKLLERKVIQKRQRITKCSHVWKLSRLSERNLDLVRHLYVS